MKINTITAQEIVRKIIQDIRENPKETINSIDDDESDYYITERWVPIIKEVAND